MVVVQNGIGVLATQESGHTSLGLVQQVINLQLQHKSVQHF